MQGGLKVAGKPLTPSERMVGRRLPPLPKHLDTVMAGFVRADGAYALRFRPQEQYLRPAFLAARKNGWIRQTNTAWSFQGSSSGRGIDGFRVHRRGHGSPAAVEPRLGRRSQSRRVGPLVETAL